MAGSDRRRFHRTDPKATRRSNFRIISDLKASITLVRPDAYVGFRAGQASVPELAKYFNAGSRPQRNNEPHKSSHRLRAAPSMRREPACALSPRVQLSKICETLSPNNGSHPN